MSSLHLFVDCGLDYPGEPEPVLRGSHQQDAVWEVLVPWVHRQEVLRNVQVRRDSLEWPEDDFVVQQVRVEAELRSPEDVEALWAAWDSWCAEHEPLFRRSDLHGLQRPPLNEPVCSEAEAEAYFRTRVDSLGKGVDSGVLRPLVALRCWGVTTTASCEGHPDRALPYPWIDIQPGSEERMQALLVLLPGWEWSQQVRGRLQPPEDLDPETAREQLARLADQLL